ncbi:MAG TPA: biopolymer transporter ExbD [Halothiobacillus sp.]|jgi:biopolymer transport protein ExbD|nr:biopolymer transporter ExbD [Halothiobacillus sp.]HQS28456.1 biopolymer transporter ExbD [Halothiobacillus sp.]
MAMRRFDQINVIPFIDIMLVLLAIVLTTATFIAQGEISVNLPQAASVQPASSDPALVISINAQGALFLDAAPVSLAELNTRLNTIEKTQAIVFSVDKKTAFGDFVAVIDALKSRGLEHLTIRTESAT